MICVICEGRVCITRLLQQSVSLIEAQWTIRRNRPCIVYIKAPLLTLYNIQKIKQCEEFHKAVI